MSKDYRRYTDADLAAATHEAFTVGRIYAKGGDKESPAEIHATLARLVAGAITRARKTRRATPPEQDGTI